LCRKASRSLSSTAAFSESASVVEKVVVPVVADSASDSRSSVVSGGVALATTVFLLRRCCVRFSTLCRVASSFSLRVLSNSLSIPLAIR
jgi:hypothetical protein